MLAPQPTVARKYLMREAFPAVGGKGDRTHAPDLSDGFARFQAFGDAEVVAQEQSRAILARAAMNENTPAQFDRLNCKR